MSEYRDEARKVERESRWTALRFAGLFVLIVAIVGGVGFGAKSLGLIGGTIVERKAFEHSYQRSEAMKARIATDKAALAEIEYRLSRDGLDDATRTNLEAQARAMRIRINTAEQMK